MYTVAVLPPLSYIGILLLFKLRHALHRLRILILDTLRVQNLTDDLQSAENTFIPRAVRGNTDKGALVGRRFIAPFMFSGADNHIAGISREDELSLSEVSRRHQGHTLITQ